MRKRHQSRLHLLTVREVQTANEGDRGDGGGLLLRVRGDLAHFVFRFTGPSGKRREMGLGPCHRGNAAQAGESLTAARELASEARTKLQRGIDPIDDREQARSAQRTQAQQVRATSVMQAWTLAKAARDYHERVIEPSRTAKHAAQWISSLENHVPEHLWKKPIGDIEPPELLEALRGIRPHKRARNLTDDARLEETTQRIRQRLDAVFEDAIFHRRCVGNPAAAIKRKMRESATRREKGSFKALPFVEAPAFLAAVRQQEGIAARCLEFALLTAARTGEVIAAEWTEFDIDASVWVIPAARMKAGESHTVYLSPAAVDLLRMQQGLDKRWVFPSPMLDGKPLSNMAMLQLLSRMGHREQTTVHGLCRATFSTWAYETAAARPDVIEACLAHKEEDLVKRAYNRAQFATERRGLLAAWAQYLIPARGEVLPFARAA